MFKDKNLLIISHNYNSFIKDQIELLAQYFNHITVLVRYKPIAEISNIIPINEFKHHRKKVVIDLSDKPQNLSVIPIPLFYIGTDSSYKKLGEKHYQAVNRLIKSRNIPFDIIHAHFTWTAGYVGAKLKEQFNKPFVVTAHGYDIYDMPFRDKKWEKNIKYVLKMANAIITVSKNNIDCIKRLDISNPTYLIPNGFLSKYFYKQNQYICRDNLRLPHDKNIILSIGNQVKIKGHTYLIKAMGKITARRKDVLCVLIGDGHLTRLLKKMTKKLQLSENILFIERKPHHEIPVWINACDLFILPSLAEGNPTVMFESLGCGKPFIGTKVGGIPEIISSEKYGFLVDQANENDLAEKILTGLDTDFNQKEILNYAQQFTWEKITEAILKIYTKIEYAHTK